MINQLKLFLFGVFLLYFSAALAQDKQQLSFENFSSWNRIENKAISPDGQWISFALEPVKGDPVLTIYKGATAESVDYPRAGSARFTADSRFAVFKIKPAMDTINRLKRERVEEDQWPVDTLVIMDLASGSSEKIPGVEDLAVPKEWSGWLAYTLKTKRDQDSLIVLHLASGEKYGLANVKEVLSAEKGEAFLASSKGDADGAGAGVYRFDCADKRYQPLWRAKGKYKSLAISNSGEKACFLADLDTSKAEIRPYGLYHWNAGDESAALIVGQGDDFLSDELLVSEHQKPTYSDDETKLYFGTASKPTLQDTSLLEEEIVEVEVWTYKDARLYPQQKVQLDRDRKKSFLAVYHTADHKLVQLGRPAIPNVEWGSEGNSKYALGYQDEAYYRQVSWEGGPSRRDAYLIDTKTGGTTLIGEGIRGQVRLSPMGRYAYWYSVLDTAWYAYEIERKKLRQITNNTAVAFYDELNDRPDYPSSYGIAGWTTNDDFIIVYDRYDAWLIDPRGHLKDNNMTRSRSEKRRMRYIKRDPEERSIEEVGPMLFHFFDEKSKESGYLSYNLHTGTKKILQSGPFLYDRRPLKAKQSNEWIFTKESFVDFPDVYYSNGLTAATKISNANPQQEAYRWGSIELYNWTSLDGQQLSGLLVKPEGFDPNKKYPLIVNFYERSSDGLHRHRAPYPGRSTISYSFYASRGYLIFNPDVPYRIGYPGESAYNAVVAGVSALVDEGFVDRANIGVQGHSWGGYQIAHLLTKTNIFKCAESGAPVVNMISAYGGIRWGSGYSRMFQYEHTQSRIGGTLWEKPLRYLENSPIFSIDKIETPVLILHNDKDSAVPWYQGIEFFVALRRLNKPAWMLNYNGEPHWPVKLQNRIDFQTRMAQFFDHYLKGAPMPVWMDRGVPAIEKGIRQGLELKP